MDSCPYLEIINVIGPPICKYWNYHRNLKEGLDTLRNKKEDLNSHKEDIQLRLSNELCFGKQHKKEVENWLKKVEQITGEVQCLEDEVGKVKFLSRAFLGKRVYEKIVETTKVYDDGSFLESLVIDAPSNSGMALPTPELVGEDVVTEEIWEYLMGDSVCKIGVCGMGGIGKTTIMKHIHNELLRVAKFAIVIWVTVSQEFDVFKLQKEIASALGEDLSNYEDITKRAAMLSKILGSRERYVLILDDVWKRIFLEEVGIPEPSTSNGCKLVITTRSIELALSMGCEAIRVEPLSDGDALNLFLNHVGRDVYVPTLESTLNEVLKQCAGLPLAIIIIGSTMRGEYDVHVWKNALNKLKKQAGSVESMAEEVFKCLKFSYDRLLSTKIKHCFLYCALYPEDFEISKEELIEYWIVEGLIDEMETRQEMYDEGLSILKRLENNCLLESVKREGCVKMHDVVRDLALHITSSESPRYLVKAGMQLEELPNEQEWKEDVEKVCLMENDIKEISSDVAIPKCRSISTLLLQNNYYLEKIHESFFKLMTGLTILDLSGNGNIKALPNSVSELENLNALLLHNCRSLEYVPSLSKIRGLKKLDLGFTNIKEVPHGMEMLVHLRYLDFNLLTEVPAGILPKLSRLQHLRLNRTPDVIAEEVAGLRKLETLAVKFNNPEGYRLYLSRLQRGCPNRYYFHVGELVFEPNYEKYVGFQGWSFCGDSILLPTDIQEVMIMECHGITSLSDRNSSFKYATDLRYCFISYCEGIECLVSSSSCYSILQSIEKLELKFLGNFCTLFSGERDRAVSTLSSSTPPGMFSRLKHIQIWGCPKIDKLFWPELVHNLLNLEQIQVYNCEQLAEIISTSDDDEENIEEGKDFTIFTLPKLRDMSFRNVPLLKCICNRGSLMGCNSLETIEIVKCPKLKRIPLLLPQSDNGQLLPLVSLRQIIVNSKECWDSLEWDHPNIEKVLKPFLAF
ncbi:hypothetical protein Ddye_026961 [Dipteronia dyeriana]|uniref:NB-ARC domain-containing protein n=1 Tax=Dipteronia dyeriana TaxID=168575 RepID=A0AAD9WQ12_9ROSI|nr:hypothetical protein Ddye_026961 [Dipteronia dyeriana]